MTHEIPAGHELTRTTATFDNETVPTGLLAAHRVAENVWGRLVVHTGAIGFVFEDEPEDVTKVTAGGHLLIPPARLHHLVLDGPASFAIEFYRPPSSTRDHHTESDSSGLEPPVS